MHRKPLFIVLTIITAGLFILDIAIGNVEIPLHQIFSVMSGHNTNPTIQTIVMDLRLPKAIVAFLAGTALSISGLQMQTLFRNPLAGPYVLGLSSGASLGVALLLLAGAASALGIAGAAMIGAAAVMFLLIIVNERVRNVMTLLILGIMFSSAISAIVQIMQYLSNEHALKSYVIWTMGSLGEVTKPELGILAAITIGGLLLCVPTVKSLNLIMLGDYQARSLGLGLRRARFMILASTTLLAGGVTAFCGPIGFIGMAVPHIARGIFRSADHRILIPASALIGAALLLACDILAGRFLLPINAITSLAGIPVIIYVVLRR